MNICFHLNRTNILSLICIANFVQKYSMLYLIYNHFFFIIQIIVDEEQESNSTNSPFKSVIIKNFHDALAVAGISTEDAFGKSASGILKWFHYLTKYFMPTSPIWSNLLLGKLF